MADMNRSEAFRVLPPSRTLIAQSPAHLSAGKDENWSLSKSIGACKYRVRRSKSDCQCAESEESEILTAASPAAVSKNPPLSEALGCERVGTNILVLLKLFAMAMLSFCETAASNLVRSFSSSLMRELTRS